MKIKISPIKKNYKKGNDKINSDFYGMIIVSTFFVLMILSSIFGIYNYKQVTKENILTNENIPGKAEREKKDRINKVLEYFKQREEKSTEIMNSSASVVDPSL